MSSPATSAAAQPAAVPHAAASPWPIFWIASVAVFLVSLDATMLYAAFSAMRAGFPEASAADMSWVLNGYTCLLYTSPSPRDATLYRMPSSA